MDHTALLRKAMEFDHGDARRIQHLLKVYTLAAWLGHEEQLSEKVQATLEAAAILHDIGIHAAETKYHSTSGKYQEREGPAPARAILNDLGYAPALIDRCCWLIAHHHT